MNLIRFAAVFALVAFGVGSLAALLKLSAETTLGSSARLMVPAMIAALIEGQAYAKANSVKPDMAVKWRFVGMATAVAILLNVALAFGAGGWLPEFGKLAVAPLFSEQFNILLGIYAVGYLICIYFFLGLGAGNQLSLMRRKGELE